MGIKHATTKSDGQVGYASEWNADHTIQAGTIVNADINAAAAIAKSKISTTGAWPLADHPAVPACRVYNDADQNTTSGATTFLTFNTENFDTDNIHDPSTNPDRLTCKTAGLYHIYGGATFEKLAGGRRQLALWVGNYVAKLACVEIGAVADANCYPGMSFSTEYRLAVNDYIRLAVYQNQGGVVIVIADGHTPSLGITCLAP